MLQVNKSWEIMGDGVTPCSTRGFGPYICIYGKNRENRTHATYAKVTQLLRCEFSDAKSVGTTTTPQLESYLGARWRRGSVTGQPDRERRQDVTQALAPTVKETTALDSGERTNRLHVYLSLSA